MKTSMKLACLLLLPLFAGSVPILAQTSETSPGKYFLFKNYTTQNGLINNGVYSMAQDRNGFIWIGTDLGLTRFDGKSFYHKVIPEIYDNAATVRYLETTPDGNIISTSLMQGVFVQQPDGQFKKFLRNGIVELGSNVFNALKYCPDNTLLASESRTLYRITGDSIIPIYDYGSAMGFFYTIDLDKDNRIWFGGRLGLGMLQPTEQGYEPVILPEFQNKFVQKILFDESGTLHVATSQGYYRIKWQPDKNYIIEQPFEAVNNISINHIYIDKAQNLWIPTQTYGVFRTKGDEITLHLTFENGLVSSTVLCMMQDRENNYWFGTENGISMIENFDNYAIAQNGVRFKEANGMTKDIYDRIWIYSRSQLHIYQDSRLRGNDGGGGDDQIIPVDLTGTPLEKVGIGQLFLFNEEMVITNQSGLYQLPVTKETPDFRKIKKIADFPANNITQQHSLRMDTTGIWITAQSKIFNYYDGRFLPVTFNHPDSSSRRPLLMKPDKYGYYWYGDVTNGLYRGVLSRPDANTLLFDSITVFRSLKADSAFITAWIYRMEFDKADNLWFSTLYTGVYKLSLDNSGVVSDKLYSTANGLLSNYVAGIECDNEGRMWFATQKGINILQYDSTGFEMIDKLDVNEGIEGQVLSSLQMGDRLFLLTEEGIFITQNKLFKENPEKAPDVFITNVLIDGVADAEIFAHTNYIRLAPEQHNLTIEYSAITFRNASDVRYQYKLEGADDDWSALSERGFVEYALLRPGRYTFKVRAAMANGHAEAGEETPLSIRVLPPYYQTIWFYLLITVGIGSLLYTFHKYRMRQVIRVERMRTRIASDLHDDIGSTLSSISLISEIASRKDPESELAKALSKIGIDSRDVLNSMDDIIWSVNPKNDSLSSLTVRLREYAIPLCESKDIKFIMNEDEAIYTLKLGMDERRNIFLIVKEAVNNAVKHSGCSQLSVAFAMKYKQLEIEIIDNGKGFDPSKRGVRNGVINMERRAAQIGVDYSIKSEKNIGTTIMLRTKNR